MYFSLVILSFLACAFGAPSSTLNGRLEGGENAVENQLPYVASLQFRHGGMVYTHECGATIVSPSWSLTSAQCKDSYDLTRYRVVAGTINLAEINENAQITSIEEFILHPNYHGGPTVHDIALLFHSTPFTWSVSVQPSKLVAPIIGDLSGAGVLSSWGRGNNDLQWAALPFITNEECAKNVAKLNPSQGCANGDGAKAACNADLGSPFAQNGAAVGIFSFTAGACDPPAVFTRIDAHIDFIVENVHDL